MSAPLNGQPEYLSSSEGHRVNNHSCENADFSFAGGKDGFKGLGASIISSLSVGVIAFDRDLKVIDANSHACSLIGVNSSIDSSLAAGTDNKIWHDWSSMLKSVISTGEKGVFKGVRYVIDGRSRLLDLSCTRLVDTDSGELIGGTLVIEDVTETIDIANQLAQSERFAAMGRVAGKVAHELNNPMDGILRYIGLAIKGVDRGDLEKPKEYLGHCRTGLLRMAQIISKLLEFSRSTYSSFEYTTVDRIVEDAVRSMQGLSRQAKVEIVRKYDGPMDKIRGGNLFQVFSNLIKNALDAMEGVGKLTITIARTEQIISIAFCDSGCGFDPGKSEAMFEPFFTTKNVGKGTGLGLAICKDLIEKYDGSIEAENNPKGGSTFTVKLPLTGLGDIQK